MKDSVLLFLVLFPIVGAFISYLIGRRNKKLRDYFAAFVCIVDLLVMILLFMRAARGEVLHYYVYNICGQYLHLELDGFRAIYGTICAFMWSMTSLFSHEYFHHYRNRNRYFFFLLLTFAGTMGVFLSGNLYTTFIFFELMSMASYVMVIHDEKPAAMRAGDTYLMIAVLGGMVMLMGLFLMSNAIGTLEIDELYDSIKGYLADGGSVKTIWISAMCMLFGFGAKAGMFPVHIWLPKAHPVAPAPASALLSCILTKSGVYGILIITSRIFLYDVTFGKLILAIGTITMFLGAFLALFFVDLKRTLACSSMSQIGFILVACGMQSFLGHHNAYAVRGALLHMVNHSVFKLILFMVAGVVYMNLHKLNLNDIRGFGRGKWFLNFAYLMGYIGIAGVPLWSGYVSKTLIHDAILHYLHELHHEGIHGFWQYHIYSIVEWIFTISGGLTFAYMTKLYIAVFWEKNVDTAVQKKYDDMNKTYISPLSKFAIGLSALIPPLFGFTSTMIDRAGKYNLGLMDRLADVGETFMTEGAHAFDHADKFLDIFSADCLIGAGKSLIIGAAVYLFFIRTLLMRTEKGKRVYVNVWPAWLDLEDSVYRPVVMVGLVNLCGFICSIFDNFTNFVTPIIIFILSFIFRVCDKLVDGIVSLFRSTLFVAINTIKSGDAFAVLNVESDSSKAVKTVTDSLSVSLLLFCLGLCIALIYLVVLNV
ncbi:MAG: sodium:proton antiporter [Lachnospiraceae bacterium]|nr:sodium:proton antiporter [Lachnospiraceae bacterium]